MKKYALLLGGLALLVVFSFVTVAYGNYSKYIKFADSPDIYKLVPSWQEFIGGGGTADQVQVVGNSPQGIEQQVGAVSFQKFASDLVGTKVGTTTTSVGFYGNHTATSTYISRVGRYANNVQYSFFIPTASSSADLQISILASNDDYCDVSTTTTIYDVVTAGQINWFDAAPFYNQDLFEGSLTNSTSSVAFNTSGMSGKYGRSLILADVQAECLALQINGSSTMVRVQERHY